MFDSLKINNKFSIYRLQKIVLADLSVSIFTFSTIGQYSNASQKYLAKLQLLLHRLLIPLLQGFAYWNKGRSASLQGISKCSWRCSGFSFFILFSLFQTQVQPFKKGVSNSATQDSIVNAHNKTQFTYARINCVLKDLGCDTPLPKILMLAILTTCASSSSTKGI
ncbi:hypothetical protein H5410_050885 [Solanum commersonii]|uniref:Uncharacterized protein n=1 Tax=Solanum commersonii TaxID=4109 RepID=A0A9J5WWU7_SOLCO|nr:hypothetical protein H5410_050885 [Solanum commersonii]